MMIRNLAIGVVLWATAGIVLAAPRIILTPFPFTVHTPIGIDFQADLIGESSHR
jgi:hypothetical protein